MNTGYGKGIGVLAAIGLVALAGCTGTEKKIHTPPSVSIISPANRATGVPASAEIAYTARNATRTTVQLTNAAGLPVAGSARADQTSWVPSTHLQYGTTYRVTVTATGTDGRTAVRTVTFTTMRQPGGEVTAHGWFNDNQVLGIGAPVVLTFDTPVPPSQRAAVQRRLFLQSTPVQEGTWNWFSGTEVHYRPRVYWRPGTQLALHALFAGVPLGGGRYGRNDVNLEASITPSAMVIMVDDTTKRLTVVQNGRVVRTMAASLGRKSMPSSSGNMVIMTINRSEVFDSSTFGLTGAGSYRETVQYPFRLTWGGQYIHSAPWSVGAQGQYDVSHGCTNISPENAAWLFKQAHVGDPVLVRNTGRPLTWGDGWTDWNVSWDQYKQGSAIKK
jgi:lipoprotein-anchoring transpeptidase ErfK/SrfK